MDPTLTQLLKYIYDLAVQVGLKETRIKELETENERIRKVLADAGVEEKKD